MVFQNIYLVLDGLNYYVWGQVVNVHRVGEYAIIEYVITSETHPDYGKHFFHPAIWSDKFAKYNDGNFSWVDMHTSYSSLDEALLGAIAYKHDGENSQAGFFFAKMIGIKE